MLLTRAFASIGERIRSFRSPRKHARTQDGDVAMSGQSPQTLPHGIATISLFSSFQDFLH